MRGPGVPDPLNETVQAAVSGIAFEVVGIPGPQGSKRHVGNGVMVESSKKVGPWRDDVKAAAVDAMNGMPPFDGAVEVLVTFTFLRPASAPKVRVHPSVRPDVDKLVRSTFDALTAAGVYTDDARVTDLTARKRYGVRAGATITVRPVVGGTA